MNGAVLSRFLLFNVSTQSILVYVGLMHLNHGAVRVRIGCTSVGK